MKCNKFYIILTMFIVGLLPMQASAYTTTTTMNVSLEVQPVPPNVTVSPLDFGIANTTSGPVSAQTDLVISATPGMVYSVDADFGQHPSGTSRNMMHTNGVDTIFYDLFVDAAHSPIAGATSTPLFSGTATASEATHTIYAVAPNTVAGKANGIYNDVVTLTISY